MIKSHRHQSKSIMECCGEVVEIRNVDEAEKFLTNYCTIESIDDFLNEFLSKWLYEWNEFDDIVTDVKEKVMLAYEDLIAKCKEKSQSDLLYISIECIILNNLHDYIVQLLHYKFKEDDLFLFDKCKLLCKCGITADQFGAPEDYAIPLTAAVVELASLDTHKSPIEKMHCLCTTYDLVFAELKAAIVEIISRSTERENDIPIIENSDVVPVLMIVIVRAKLIHLRSNIYYIDNFLWKLKESKHITNTIAVFKSAIDKLETVTQENLLPGCEKICKDMNLAKVMGIMEHLEMSRSANKENMSLIDFHNRRVSDLIIESTSFNLV